MRIKPLPVFFMLIIGIAACKLKEAKTNANEPIVYRGLYSLTPEAKTYKDCATGRKYWVGDTTNTLELKYWDIVSHEKPEAPVYIEVEGAMKMSSTADDGGHGDNVGYDSMLVVTKILKITKDIPAGMCKN